jgi:hypothetical protein
MAQYQVVIQDFADTTTFGPGSVIAILENATNVGWSEYINEVSEAFFTMSQEDAKIALLTQAVDSGKHCRIYRDGTLVWGGWLGEADENLDDVVFTAYSYISGFYHYVQDWDKEWTGEEAAVIIGQSFDHAKNLTKSRVGWMVKNTVQNLWVESGGPTTLELPLYRAPYKRILSIFREITAYAISDTSNRVKFFCQPDGDFFLLRNDTTLLTDVRWKLGDGKVRSYQRIRLPVDRRNQILAVGTSPKDTLMRKIITKTANRDAVGLKQEPIYMSWVKNESELDRVANLRATRAVRVDTDLFLTFFKDTVIPYRAADQDFQIGDETTINLSRGASSIVNEIKVIVGQQVIYMNGCEYVRVLLQDRIPQ